MLGEERQAAILSIVEERGSVTTSELINLFDTSESTIRRDLAALDAEGLIVKVHGGAIAKDTNYRTTDDELSIRIERNRDDKSVIAKYAAMQIEKDDMVYLDAGSTTELMIEYLSVKDVVFVTNSFNNAKKLYQRGYTAYVLGGEFKGLTEAIVGEEAILSLEKYNFTKGFFGANGVNEKNGYSTPDIKEAMVKKIAMSRSRERFILADKSKISKISSVSFGDFNNAILITNKLENNMFKNKENVREVE